LLNEEGVEGGIEEGFGEGFGEGGGVGVRSDRQLIVVSDVTVSRADDA